MGKRKKRLPGLNRNAQTGNWILDKRIAGKRVYKSTGTQVYEEAERRAIKWIRDAEEAAIHGKPICITFDEAAAYYIQTETKKSLDQDISCLKQSVPMIGKYYLDEIHNETIQPFVKSLQKKGRKATTINRHIRVIVRILNLAAALWRDEYHRPYLETVPLIKQLPENDKEITRPIEYTEEEKLLNEFNEQYKDYWTFAVNTGLRQQNQAGLLWEWEVQMPALETTGFVIPGIIENEKNTKNGKDFLLVLNSKARAIIEKYRGRDAVYVFPSPKGGKYDRFNNKHFKNARARAGLKGVIKWHSARTTFATRLRAVGVNEEDRAQLMGHASVSITTQYSWADVQHLIACVEKLCKPAEEQRGKMDLATLFRIEK